MKKIKLMIIIAFVFLFTAAAVYARAEVAMPYPRYDNYFGANQYYSVVFDGEGEALVLAKLVVQNSGDTPLSSLSLEIPGKHVRIVNAFQETPSIERRCVYHHKETGECLEWNEYRGRMDYHSIDIDKTQLSKSIHVVLDLEEDIEEQETATIILYYKAEGFVGKGFGVYDFDFETIKWKYDTTDTRVAVNVMQDLHLKGGKSKVDYMPTISFESAKSSEALSGYSNRIEWQRGFVKEVSGLDPFESFHVTGEYAKSWFLLHKIGMIIVLVLIAAGAAFSITAFRRFRMTKRSMVSKVVAMGFVNNVALGLLFLISWGFFANLDAIVGRRYDEIIGVFAAFLIAICVIMILVGPAIYMGKKHGVMAGVFTIVSTIVWAFFVLVVLTISLAAAGIGTGAMGF